jgi:hypothetical protein
MGISKHWLLSTSCHYPELTDHELEVFTGILMSDGCIDRTHNHARISIDMITEKYLNWLYDTFQPLFTSPRQIMTAEEAGKQTADANGGFVDDPSDYDFSPIYRIRTRSMPAFDRFDSWYDDSGNKVWPKNIMTPTVFKHFYVGDGHFDTHNSSGNISIRCSNESENMQAVVEMFKSSDLPVPTVSGDDTLFFGVKESETLFDMMGSAPPGFEYKWPDKK